MMADNSKQKTKRLRANAPKNRTGCGTCKIRHRRCDEAKPICNSCHKTGRICDGYIDPSTGKKFGGHAGRISPFFGLVPRTLFANEGEAQGFQSFETATEIQFSAALMNNPWAPSFLQLAQQDPAIYHAVIATGIMSRTYQATPVFSTWDSQSNSMYQVALQQYGKAVACFRWQLAGINLDDDHSPSPPNALTCCILLIIFEFMQGNASGIRLHLKNAIKFAAGLGKCPQGQLFANLLALIDMIMMMWLNLDQSYSDISLQIPEVYANKISLTRQSDLETLTYDLVNIKNEVMTWRHAVSARRNAKAQGIGPNNTSYTASWRTIQSKLDFWHRKFTAVSPTEQDIATHRPSLLRVNYLVTVLIVNEVHNKQLSAQSLTKTNPTAGSNSAKLEYFQEIIELIEGVLEAGYCSSRYDVGAGEELLENTGLLPLFSFRNSFIQPLFYVAQKSPHIQLRQKAIRLLLRKPWREGAWDSFIMGSIAQDSLDASISEV
ncbi:hypothetical protein UA08_03260 [Talaromyces atroroseus]|uniref:Zn(2)-C6 fungal-type domain-containing protein n=1 Tax=Talaromyces atroroseus TaxID=1441469 RepID=A0A225B0T0_TALAT|nr:hypothetical protein UA08_03260 [Talaromyces atroroseus]OKL61579.1 hypothetical protein UA08_03260 [Talaromyces atroroseus]